MSAINESLRKLEERGALASTALPVGVAPAIARTSGGAQPPAGSNRPMLYLIVFLTVVWAIWSEWDRRHPVAVAGPQPVPVAAVVVPPSTRPAEPPVPTAAPVTAAVAPKPVRPVPPAPQNTPAPARAAAPVPVPAAASATGPVVAPAQPEPVPAPVPRKPPVALSTEPVNKVTTPHQRADMLYTQALRKLQEGRGSDGRYALQELLAQAPAHDDARQLLAALLLEDRQFARAETLLQDGLAHQPSAAALLMLARLKVERGEDAAALGLLTEHLAKGQGDGEYRALMAALLVRQDRPAEAAAHYRAAVERQPARGTWWAGLGLALAAQPAQAGAAWQALDRARALGGLPGPLADRVEVRWTELARDDRKP
jgi:predicted negative regulator of RcsB-dependent stress response